MEPFDTQEIENFLSAYQDGYDQGWNDARDTMRKKIAEIKKEILGDELTS